MSKLFLHKAILLLFVCMSINSFSQDSTMLRKHPPKKSILDKMFIGGNLGFQYGQTTVADVSPLVGYKITDKISAGIGVTYQYLDIKYTNYDFQTNVYGGRVFGRYFFTDYLFAHAEYEYLNLQAYDFPDQRVGVGSLLGGGGYFQHYSANSGVMAMVLYNFTESGYTPYPSPIIIRVGVIIGL